MPSVHDIRPYGGQAAVYDREYRCYVQDLRLYLDRLRYHRVRGPLLELGVGTGRVALGLASAGHPVLGIDLSEAMLRAARRRRRHLDPEAAARLSFARADIAGFRLARRFDAVVGPFSILNLLVEPASRASCLARCREHLSPGGMLWLDVPVPREPRDGGPRPTRTFHEVIPLPRYGHEMRKVTVERPDPARGIDHIRYEYSEVRMADGATLRSYAVVFPLARLAPAAVEAEVEAAGFDVVERFGDYLGSPFGPASDRMVLEAVRR